jgi:hypothetical protein
MVNGSYHDSFVVMENNKLDLQCNELIQFFITDIVIATKVEWVILLNFSFTLMHCNLDCC